MAPVATPEKTTRLYPDMSSFGTFLVIRLIFTMLNADPLAARRTMQSPPPAVNGYIAPEWPSTPGTLERREEGGCALLALRGALEGAERDAPFASVGAYQSALARHATRSVRRRTLPKGCDGIRS